MAYEFIEQFNVGDVQIGDRHRQVLPDKVKMLADSMSKIGLISPIFIRKDNTKVTLVAGAHRLTAANILGWKKIDCIVLDCDEVDAEILEIAENLHRVELTKEQRDKQIRRYAELLVEKFQFRQSVAIESKREDGRGHRAKGIASKIADETGLSVRTVQRVLAEPKPVRDQQAKAPVVFQAQEMLRKIAAECAPADQFDEIRNQVLDTFESYLSDLAFKAGTEHKALFKAARHLIDLIEQETIERHKIGGGE